MSVTVFVEESPGVFKQVGGSELDEPLNAAIDAQYRADGLVPEDGWRYAVLDHDEDKLTVIRFDQGPTASTN